MKELRKQAEEIIKDHENIIDNLPIEAKDIVHELRVYQAELEVQNAELRRAMQATEESQQRFLRLYDSVPVGLLVVGRNGIVQQSNRAFQTMLETDATVVGKPLYTKIHMDDRNGYLARWRSFYDHQGSEEKQPFIARLATTAARWVRIEKGRSDPNLTDGVSLVVVDITEIKRAEEARASAENQLYQSQKMEAVGQLAGGVAHDFNNQLQVMMGYCELSMRTQNSNRRQKYLNSVYEAIEHSQNLINQLLAFSRGGQIEKEIVNVEDLLADLAGIVTRTFDPRIRCLLKTNSTESYILANKNQLHNALLNLCVNARDALIGGGKLSISSQSIDYKDSWTSAFNADRPAGSYVEISITDDGQGMESEVLRRATEPFFTTKPKGSGTGLGLSAVYGMVDGLGGDFMLTSAVGRGTTATLILPTHPSLERKTRTYRPPSQVTHRTDIIASKPGRPVLVVDDDKQLRALAIECLEDIGIEVVEASNGREAVDYVSSETEAFAAIIMDLLMPHMDGAEATRHIKQMQPDTPIILATGYGADDHIEEARRAGVDAIIHKPFSMSDLTRLVSKILNQEPPHDSRVIKDESPALEPK